MKSDSKLYSVVTFYKFKEISNNEVSHLEALFEKKASEMNIMGLMIFGTEGINCTLSAEKKNLISYLKLLEETFDGMVYKWSESPFCPFRRFALKVRSEIVTIGKPGMVPNDVNESHLSAKEWHELLSKEKDDVVVVDTRNWYETDIGKFKNALDLRLDEFTEFADALDKEEIDKNKKVLIYCTGGIRCEKAILELNERGYKNVFQLHGGILKYMEEYPEGHWEGECFVFDHRVAVDKNLNPSKSYEFCPHCGQPGNVKIICERCDVDAVVCQPCLDKDSTHHTCSKNCAYHMKVRPGKGRHQDLSRSVKGKKAYVFQS